MDSAGSGNEHRVCTGFTSRQQLWTIATCDFCCLGVGVALLADAAGLREFYHGRREKTAGQAGQRSDSSWAGRYGREKASCGTHIKVSGDQI